MEIIFKLPGRFNSPRCKSEFTQDDLDGIYDDFIAGMIQVDTFYFHLLYIHLQFNLNLTYYVTGD